MKKMKSFHRLRHRHWIYWKLLHQGTCREVFSSLVEHVIDGSNYTFLTHRRIDIPDILTADEINARLGFVNIVSSASVVDQSLVEDDRDNASDVNTTQEDDWWGALVAREDDTDSVDEFVDRFLRTHRPRTGSDDTDRSSSPPPPPPPRTKHSVAFKTTSAGRRTTTTHPSARKRPQAAPTYNSKPTRIAPHLIGAAADRGRWLFAKPSST